MKKIIPLALHNLKKDKKQYISFGIIVLLTALILNLGLVLMFGINPAYDEKFSELNGADIDVMVSDMPDSCDITDKIKEADTVKDAEKRKGILLNATINNFRGTDFDVNIVFYNKDDVHEINRLESIKQAGTEYENPIYLPLYIAEFGEFDIGQEITFETEEKSYTFQVAGIVQEMQYGNYGVGMIGAYLPNESYHEFVEENVGNTVCNYSVKINENEEPDVTLRKIESIAKDNGLNVVFKTTSSANKQSRTMICNLLIMILSAFALIVLSVSMFLCKFRIKNTIEEEITDMGVLKALGFTSGMIVLSVMLPYVAVAVISSAIGAAASYLFLSVLIDMLALQAGFRFDIGFDGISVFVAVCVLTAVTLIFTYFSAVKIRKLHPILAIRGESEKGKVRKNHFPIEKTHGNIQFVLTLKHMASSVSQNILLFFVLFAMTVLVSFSGNLFYNVIIKPENFMNTLSEEAPSAIIQTSDDETESVKTELTKKSDVLKVLEYSTESVKIANGNITAFVCEDFASASNDLCYEGRNPENADEIAVGNAIADVENYRVGDIIEVSCGENVHTYKIVGFIQSVNYQGEVCAFTNEGFNKLNGEYKFNSLYVYLNDGVDTEKFITELEADYPNLRSLNYDKMQKTSQEMFSGIVNVVIVVVFLLTASVVLLILFVIVRSMIVQRKQEFGIYKAIGYSGKQLVFQIAGSFMPVSFLAVLSSALLGCVYVPAMNNMIFQTIGAMKNNLQAPIGILLAFAAAELILTFAISVALAVPVKKISAYSLIKE